MRTARTAAAVIGAVIIGALSWAMPAQATGDTPKVTATVTKGDCGTATISIVLAPRVSGVYNATYYVGGKESGKVSSTGTVKASKVVAFPEDSHGGLAEVRVTVEDGWPAFRPATITEKIDTDCKPPVAPTVTAVGPTCASKDMTVTVTNPNTLAADKVQVRIGFAAAKVLAAGESTSRTVRGPLKVWAGTPLKPLKLVPYVRPTGCVTPTPTATATGHPTPTATATPPASATGSPTSTAGGATAPPMEPAGNNSNDDGGALPVTGAGVAGMALAGVLALAGGAAAFVVARRRRTRFTA